MESPEIQQTFVLMPADSLCAKDKTAFSIADGKQLKPIAETDRKCC